MRHANVVAAIACCILMTPRPSSTAGELLQDDAQPAASRPETNLDKVLGGRLIEQCGAVVNSSDALVGPALSFSDKLFLEAGDFKSMSREDLEDFGERRRVAAMRDLGLVYELNWPARPDKRSAIPPLQSKWAGLRGIALEAEFYRALSAALQFREGEARAKKSGDQGFADRLLAHAAIVNLSRTELDDFRDELRDAELRDEAFSAELALDAEQGPSERRASLWERWSKLRGERLKDEYYPVVSRSLQEGQKKADLKKPSQRTLADDLLLEAKPAAGLTRKDVDGLYEVYRIASKCDAARKRTAAKPKQPG